MFIRKYWLPVSVFILTIAGIGLYLLATQPPKDPVVIYKSVEPIEKPTMQAPVGDTSEGGHFHADGTWHGEPHDPPAAPAVLNRSTFAPIAVADGVNPTSTSSNPMFADGVPEHLQCPPEFIGTYAPHKENELEKLRQLMPIYYEVRDKWNPNRPIAELWDAKIAYEKWCRDNADPERRTPSLAGQGRIDWLVQLWLDFPELTVLSEEDPERFRYMVRVDIGDWSPDFNAFEIPHGSGRIFRTDDDKKYVFTGSSYTEKEGGGYTSRTYKETSGPSNGDPNAEVVEINLDEVTDEDLERLGGWNYNINPYTTGAYKLGDHKK